MQAWAIMTTVWMPSISGSSNDGRLAVVPVLIILSFCLFILHHTPSLALRNSSCTFLNGKQLFFFAAVGEITLF